MRISSVSNQQDLTFGVKYLNKANWNQKALKTFESSNLRKCFDKKYPNATVSYKKLFDYESESHTLSVGINLAKDKLYRWTLSSHQKDVPVNHFVEFINKTSLEEIEKRTVGDLKPLATVTITPIKPSFLERIKNSFNKFFA